MRIDEHPVLGPAAPRRRVRFFFEGRPVAGREGEPLAAALYAAGILHLSTNPATGEPRGLYCAIGHCYECRVEVDGVAGVRACLEPVREGVRVRRLREESTP